MEVFVNNKSHFLDQEKILDTLLVSLGILNTRGLAIAVNDSVIPKGKWHEYHLHEKDQVTIIQATQGG